jgi:hypothetical protein
MVERDVEINAGPDTIVSGILSQPEDCCPGLTPALILAHGASNDMSEPLLAAVAEQLAGSGVASVLRFNFPFTERGVDRPDANPVLERTYVRAHDALRDDPACAPGKVFLGGKSLGARIAAELVSRGPEGEGLTAAGLVFLGFPLHGPGRKERAHWEPLRRVSVPSLFVTGTKDPFSDLEILASVIAGLKRPGELFLVEQGDHSLKVPKSHPTSQEAVYVAVAEKIGRFVKQAVER